MTSKKILVTGYAGAGKSSLIQRFLNNTFCELYLPHHCISIEKKIIDFNGQSINLVIWDAPKENYHLKYPKSHFLGASALIHVIDVNKPSTFADIDQQLGVFYKQSKQLPVYLACTQSDVNPRLEAESYFENILPDRKFFTSARTGEQVNELFNAVIEQLLTMPSDSNIKIY